MHQPYAAVPAYQTKDGSEIRELMHPGVHGNVNQSLVDATVLMGAATWPHLHHMAEELYHILRGRA